MSKVTWSTSCKEDWKLSRREWDGIVPPAISNTSIETGVEIVPIVPSFDIVLVNWKASFCWVDILSPYTAHTLCANNVSISYISSWSIFNSSRCVLETSTGHKYYILLISRTSDCIYKCSYSVGHEWISKGFKECFCTNSPVKKVLAIQSSTKWYGFHLCVKMCTKSLPPPGRIQEAILRSRAS